VLARDHNDCCWIWIRQRPNQRNIDHGDHGDSGTEAESERKERSDGENFVANGAAKHQTQIEGKLV
jgi:hypothetical protein